MNTQQNKECKLSSRKQFPERGSKCEICVNGPCAYLRSGGNHSSGGKGRKSRRSQHGHSAHGAFPHFRYSAEVESYSTTPGAYHAWNESLGIDYTEHSPSEEYERVVQESGLTEFFRFPVQGCAVGHCKVFSSRNYSGLASVVHDRSSESSLFNNEQIWEDIVPVVDRVKSTAFQSLYQAGYLDLLDDILESFTADLRVQSYQTMRPSLSTGFSLLNFLYELKDFRSWYLRFKNASSGAWRLGRSLYDRPLNTLSDLAAEGLLEFEFGVLPTISDIQKIITILSSFAAKTTRFLEDANALVNRRHFRRAYEATTELIDRLTISGISENIRSGDYTLPAYFKMIPSIEPQTHEHGSSSGNQGIYTATMDYDYVVSKIVDCNSYVLSLLQQLGVRPSAAILWNAVPFSFLVDWFVRVGDFLDTYASVDVISADVNIHEWIESHRIRFTWSILVDSDLVPGNYIQTIPDCTSAVGGILYRRGLGNPDLDRLQMSTSDGFTPIRTSISAALVKKLILQ